MHDCRCPHDGKKLAEIGRPPLQAMTGDQLCTCGRWITAAITQEYDQIVSTVRCLCGYQNIRIIGYVVKIPCPKCKRNISF